MPTHTPLFYLLGVAAPIVVTEVVLLICARTLGDRGAYRWYSGLLRTLAYSPCILVGGQDALPLPLSTALALHWRGETGGILWLYGLPEVLVGTACLCISAGIRMMGTPGGPPGDNATA